MRSTLNLAHPGTMPPHHTRDWRKPLLAAVTVLLPYAIAALGLFIYHGQ